MAPLLRRRLVMDDNTLIALLDDLVAPRIDVAPGARRQPLRVIRIRHFFLVGVLVLHQRVLIGAGPAFQKRMLRGLLPHLSSVSHTCLLLQSSEHEIRCLFRGDESILDGLVDSGNCFIVFVAITSLVGTEWVEVGMFQFVFYRNDRNKIIGIGFNSHVLLLCWNEGSQEVWEPCNYR